MWLKLSFPPFYRFHLSCSECISSVHCIRHKTAHNPTPLNPHQNRIPRNRPRELFTCKLSRTLTHFGILEISRYFHELSVVGFLLFFIFRSQRCRKYKKGARIGQIPNNLMPPLRQPMRSSRVSAPVYEKWGFEDFFFL